MQGMPCYLLSFLSICKVFTDSQTPSTFGSLPLLSISPSSKLYPKQLLHLQLPRQRHVNQSLYKPTCNERFPLIYVNVFMPCFLSTIEIPEGKLRSLIAFLSFIQCINLKYPFLLHLRYFAILFRRGFQSRDDGIGGGSWSGSNLVACRRTSGKEYLSFNNAPTWVIWSAYDVYYGSLNKLQPWKTIYSCFITHQVQWAMFNKRAGSPERIYNGLILERKRLLRLWIWKS